MIAGVEKNMKKMNLIRHILILLLITLLVGTVSADTVITWADYDGSMIEGTDQNWLPMRNDTGDGYTGMASSTLYGGFTTATTTNPVMNNHYRSGLSFPPNASLPADATIDSVTVSIKGKSKAKGLGTTNFCIINFTPASFPFVATDYDNTKFERMADDIAYASYSTTGYNTFTLNAEGITRVSKTGNTTFMFTHSYDTDFMNLTWANAQYSGFMFSSVSESAGANKPYMTINFTPKVG